MNDCGQVLGVGGERVPEAVEADDHDSRFGLGPEITRLFHPLNSLVVRRNLRLMLLSKI